MAEVIRGTYPAPQPRTSILGVDIEDRVTLDVSDRTLRGFYASFDVVNPDGSTRRIASDAYAIPLTQAEWNAIRNALASAFGRVLPPGTVLSIETTP